MTEKEHVTLGSGKVYVAEYVSAGTIPSNSEIEIEANRVGHVKNGAELQYSYEQRSLEDDFGIKVMSFITKENVVFKSGWLSWNGASLAKLSPTSEIEKTNSLRTVKIGGREKDKGKSYLLRFVHTKQDGLKIRVTIRGVASSGFTLTFKPEDATVIDAEFKALSLDESGTLVVISEELEAITIA